MSFSFHPFARSQRHLPVIESWLRGCWKLLVGNRKVLLGTVITGLFLLLILCGPLLARQDPDALTTDVLSPPSPTHWLGTTQIGQDVFAQMIIGSRTSIFWGLATSLLVTVLSVGVGLVGGYVGGWIDELFSLVTNIFLVLPAFPLAVVMAAYVPVKGPWTVAFVLLVTSWASGARVLRAQTLSLRHREFVDAARASGEFTWRIIFYEILPNEMAIVVAGFIGTMLYVILAAAGLEFLGLGDIRSISWGSMFYWAQNNNALLLGAWWWFLPPGMGIALLGAGLAFLNFGIDEIVNPRLRQLSLQVRIARKGARLLHVGQHAKGREEEEDRTLTRRGSIPFFSEQRVLERKSTDTKRVRGQ